MENSINIINLIVQVASYGAGLAVVLGLSEWLVKFFLNMVLDRWGRR